ncbi:unnamed protein product [Rhodiola kirilowii]
MEDEYFDSYVSEIIPMASSGTGLHLGFILDNVGYFWSSIDYFFSQFFTATSYISCRFLQFIDELIMQDVRRSSEGLRVFTSYERGTSSGTLDPEVSGTKEDPLVNKQFHLAEPTHIPGINLVFKGLMLPFFGLRFAWRCHFRCINCVQVRVNRFISRVRKTLNGSSGDIGWLQHTPGFPPVKDGTARFMELLENIRNGAHVLPNSYVYLLIPGLLSNHGPLYFVSTKRFFSKKGLACHIAKIHSEASVEHNAWELKNYIEELYWGSGKRVMLLGHSKGGVDAAAALSLYWSDLEEKVAGLALVQSPYGGTPLASDILREGQIADKETRRIMELLICKFIKGDIRALEDLTYERRREFIMKNKLPEIPLISFHSEASIAPGVLATLTQIAHAELPWLPFPSFGNEEVDDSTQAIRKIPVVMPVSAAMAVCALHLQLRYGEKSDGLVTCRDAEVPGSVVVRPDRKLDHAWMVYSSWNKNSSEPDCCEMCEALLTLLVEIGEMKMKLKMEKLNGSKRQIPSKKNN